MRLVTTRLCRIHKMNKLVIAARGGNRGAGQGLMHLGADAFGTYGSDGILFFGI